ncbi:5-methylcytosine-specific restriction endonuclease McrA, partial [Streptacidiphilus sp. MAP12-20]
RIPRIRPHQGTLAHGHRKLLRVVSPTTSLTVPAEEWPVGGGAEGGAPETAPEAVPPTDGHDGSYTPPVTEDFPTEELAALQAEEEAAQGQSRRVQNWENNNEPTSTAPHADQPSTGTSEGNSTNEASAGSSNVSPNGDRNWKYQGPNQVRGAAPKYVRKIQFRRMAPSARTAALKNNPTCVYCNEAPSTQADHVYPVSKYYYRGGWGLDKPTRSGDINQGGNLRGACDECNGFQGKSGKVLGPGPDEWWPPAWPPGVWWPFGGAPS